MDSVLRGAAVYFFLLIAFRVAGKRTLANITTFDFILILIISETVQQAMIDNDNSMTNAMLLVVTLVSVDMMLSLVKRKFKKVEQVLDGTPVLIIREGEMLRDRMAKERVDEDDILHAARERQGISRLDEIDYAIIEASGGITIIPKKK